MAKGKQTREAIIAAAVTLLGREGPDGFSAAALAREAGTSKANIFHHFPTIEAIPPAAFDHLAAEMLAPTLGDGARSTREWVAELGRGVRRMVLEQRAFLNAYFVFFGQSLFAPAMRERLQRSLAPFLAAVAERLEEDGRNRAEAKATARLIVASLDGLALHLLISGREGEIVAAWETFLDLLFPEDG